MCIRYRTRHIASGNRSAVQRSMAARHATTRPGSTGKFQLLEANGQTSALGSNRKDFSIRFTTGSYFLFSDSGYSIVKV